VDINQLNGELRGIHARIADLQKYRAHAESTQDAMAMYNFDREIRDLQTDAKALQGQIDGLNTPDVKL
jgi:predicted  nucleic acid-binding Zn-ribbon protein